MSQALRLRRGSPLTSGAVGGADSHLSDIDVASIRALDHYCPRSQGDGAWALSDSTAAGDGGLIANTGASVRLFRKSDKSVRDQLVQLLPEVVQKTFDIRVLGLEMAQVQ